MSFSNKFWRQCKKIYKDAIVFYDDASYKDTSGVSTFSSAESDRYDALLRMANGSLQRGKKVLELLKRQNNLLSVGARLKIFFNTKVREGRSIGGVANLQKEFRKYYASVLDDD